jgi:hypothetical protein
MARTVHLIPKSVGTLNRFSQNIRRISDVFAYIDCKVHTTHT